MYIVYFISFFFSFCPLFTLLIINCLSFTISAFQVLTDWCVSWEGHSICVRGSTFISLGLVQQVSLLLTNHLSRDMKTLVTLESGELWLYIVSVVGVYVYVGAVMGVALFT